MQHPRQTASKVAVLCGALSALAGAVVLVIGWAIDVPVLRSLLPGPISTKASTGAMFVLCGAGVALLAGDEKAKRIGRVCVAACLVMALVFLSQYVAGWNLGIDELPFRDVVARAAHAAYPGRPGLTTLICVVLICVSLLGMRRHRRCEGALMAPVLGVAGLCVVGLQLGGQRNGVYGPHRRRVAADDGHDRVPDRRDRLERTLAQPCRSSSPALGGRAASPRRRGRAHGPAQPA